MPETTRGELAEEIERALSAPGNAAGMSMRGTSEEWRTILAALRSDPADAAEMRERAAKELPRIEFYQQDWLPGFAAFLPAATTPSPGSRAFCVLNLPALVGAYAQGDLPAADIPAVIADSMMHEVIHAIEQWAGVEFSEERVEGLIARYRALPTQGGEP